MKSQNIKKREKDILCCNFNVDLADIRMDISTAMMDFLKVFNTRSPFSFHNSEKISKIRIKKYF